MQPVDIFIIIILSFVVVYTVKKSYKNFKSGKSCCDCNGCDKKVCHTKIENNKNK